MEGGTEFLNHKCADSKLDISIVKEAIIAIQITFDNLDWIIEKVLSYNDESIITEILYKITTYNMLVKDIKPEYMSRLILKAKNNSDSRFALITLINNKISNDVNDITNHNMETLLEEYNLVTTEDNMVKR